MNDQTTNHKRRRVVLAAVLGLFLIAGLVYAVYWLTIARYVVSTDDAYVAGNVVQITPQVAGTATAIGADETQFVKAGQMLVQLDRADTQAALQKDEAQLARTVREIRNLFVRSSQLQAAIDAREVDVARARTDLERREKLAHSGAVSSEDVQHAREALRGAQAALDEVRQQLAGNQALIDGTTVATHPSVQNAAAQLRTAYLDYQRTVIPAPVSGIVAKRTVQLGQRVSPGAPLMAVVPLKQVWVDANFKEGQLRDIRPGQPARLVADANDFEYHGTVVGFAAGTGAAFALLPAQNATGNWIKVVQRLPVRIALDPKELAAHPLQIGLSLDVEVDVHQKSGAALPRAHEDPAPAYSTDVYANQERDVDALIAKIIAENDAGAARVAQKSSAGEKDATGKGTSKAARVAQNAPESNTGVSAPRLAH
jgi:membrane fusion protein (multidrug efflux system)